MNANNAGKIINLCILDPFRDPTYKVLYFESSERFLTKVLLAGFRQQLELLFIEQNFNYSVIPAVETHTELGSRRPCGIPWSS